MATTANLNVTLSWSNTDTNNANSTYSDVGSYIYSKALQSGASYTDIDNIWHETRTLTSGGGQTYSMTGLPTTIFDGSYYASLSAVKLIYVENLATGTGHNINICATGLGAFTNMFNGGSGNLIIPAKSPFLIASYLTGIPVNFANHAFTIRDLGGITGTGSPVGCQIRVAIIGL
jgi:hypothetical protein